jgi:hypothetical protein
MPLVRELAELIKLTGDVIKSTREILAAFNDGRKYLARHYPEAQGDLKDLLEQMERAIEGLSSVTGVISGFRFTIVPNAEFNSDTARADLVRFNEYLIEQRDKTTSLKSRIRELKANCDKVRQLRDKLDARSQSRTWGSMFELFGLSARNRSIELASALGSFYADDQQMIELLTKNLDLAESAISEVESTLGPPATQNPYNVPIAAQTLGIYAELFRAPDLDLQSLANELNSLRMTIA